MEQLREKFLSAYADIPNSLRKEIIIIADEKTYTWDSTYFEVKNNTKLSEKLLNTLSELKII
ncbi:hypothetical protein KAT36_01750 [Candidatus Pacearchaeota archaeon]|nr:hypothetical protein [Candidatus Pacearchaeota archaeon]